MMTPLLKWPGGKRKLLFQILRRFPPSFDRYFEPFLGGASIFFGCDELREHACFLSDIDSDLINFYEEVRDHPEELLADALKHQNTKEHYYETRGKEFEHPIQKAGQFIYLNKTCFNGLRRVNSKTGRSNVPYGSPKKYEPFSNRENFFKCSEALFGCSLICESFIEALKSVRKNDLIYLDPPYDPVRGSSSDFKGYDGGSFGREEQTALRRSCDLISDKGGYFILSNSSTSFIRELYVDLRIEEIDARRSISASKVGRRNVTEFLITNY